MSRLPAAAGLALLAAVGAITAGPAQATFAGRDGRIAFQHFSRNAPPQIVTLSPRGQDARTVTDLRGGVADPEWAPRGGRIAFTRLPSGGRPGAVATMRAGGKNLKRISHGCVGHCLEDYEPAYSPDGRRIVFSRAFGPIVDDTADHVDLMIVRRNGADIEPILRFRDPGSRRLEPHGPQWSPDGERLAVTLLDLNDPDLRSAVFTLELDSGDLNRVTPWRLNAGNPDWSPDGRRILFNSHWEGQDHSSLYTIAPNGTALRRLTHPRGRFTFEPTFSPSGRRVVFVVAGRGVTLHLARMNVGGANREPITRSTLRGVQPDWGSRP